MIAKKRGSRSHRWRSVDQMKEAQRTVSPGKKKAHPGVLAAGRWRPEIARSLEKVFLSYGKERPDYTPADPPVAVLSWDDASITHHLGEAIFYSLVTNAEFKFNEEFWKKIPLHFGRLRIRAGYNEFHREPRRVWNQNAYYRIYRKEFLKTYQSLCLEYGRKWCARWRVQLLTGFDSRELRLYARNVIERELKTPVGKERVGLAIEDPAPVIIRTGLRWIPEMRDLYAKLKDHGFDVWVLGTSNQWAMEEMAEAYGVDRSRVAGMRTKLVDGRLTSQPLVPIPIGAGAAEAIVMFIGRSPALIVAGDEEAPMLSYGRGIRIRVGGRREGLPGFEKVKSGVQPRFSPVVVPQEWESLPGN